MIRLHPVFPALVVAATSTLAAAPTVEALAGTYGQTFVAVYETATALQSDPAPAARLATLRQLHAEAVAAQVALVARWPEVPPATRKMVQDTYPYLHAVGVWLKSLPMDAPATFVTKTVPTPALFGGGSVTATAPGPGYTLNDAPSANPDTVRPLTPAGLAIRLQDERPGFFSNRPARMLLEAPGLPAHVIDATPFWVLALRDDDQGLLRKTPRSTDADVEFGALAAVTDLQSGDPARIAPVVHLLAGADLDYLAQTLPASPALTDAIAREKAGRAQLLAGLATPPAPAAAAAFEASLLRARAANLLHELGPEVAGYLPQALAGVRLDAVVQAATGEQRVPISKKAKVSLSADTLKIGTSSVPLQQLRSFAPAQP